MLTSTSILGSYSLSVLTDPSGRLRSVCSRFLTTSSLGYNSSQNCENRLLASSCLSVRPSLCVEKLDSYWEDFHGIWYLIIFRKSVEKIQVSLKLTKNNGQYDQYTLLINLDHFVLECFRENLNTHFCSLTLFFFFFENRAIYVRYRGKILYSQTGHRWQYRACALHAGSLKPQTHTQNM